MAGCSMITTKQVVGMDEGKAKQFAPDPSSALIYVYRESSFIGKNAHADFVVNNKIAATNAPGQFSVILVSPGKYDLFCHSGNEANAMTSLIHNKTKGKIEVNAEAGKIYYYQQEFKSMSGFSLKEIPAAQAQEAIKKLTLKEVNRL